MHSARYNVDALSRVCICCGDADDDDDDDDDDDSKCLS